MSPPDFVHASNSADEQPSPLVTGMGSADSGEALLVQDMTLLLAELSQLRSIDHDRIDRIHYLEQALDQALVWLAELRDQVHDQSVLETQLAKTEEFANVQHQAIARLKHQLQQHEQALQVRDQWLLYWMSTDPSQLDHATDASDLPRQLSLELDTVSAPAPINLERPEFTLDDARHHIQDLTRHIVALDVELQQSRRSLEEQKVLELTLRQTKTLATNRQKAIAALEKELAIAQIKVEELETQLAKQLKLQAKWQQKCQELEAESEGQRSRLADLDGEVAEMQEQIFQQARQATEYEAAIQHWKDRSLSSHRLMVQLKDLLEQTLPAPDEDVTSDHSLATLLSEVLAALQLVVNEEESEPLPLSALPSPRFTKLDIPEFLIRRRNYRGR